MPKPSSRISSPIMRSASFAAIAAAGLLATASLVSTLGASPNLDRVLDAQRSLVAEQPRSATAQNDLGNLLVVANRLAEAEAAYQRAIELQPSDPVARFNLGLLQQQMNRAGEATETFENLIEGHPDHAWGHYQLGILAEAANRRPRALELYARAFALDPNLSFADVNPHVIDNELATEALLLSSRYAKSPTSRVPRHYAEADRLAELMLEIEAEAIAAEEAAGEVEVVEGEPESSADESMPSSSSSGSSARFDSGPDETGGVVESQPVGSPVREARSLDREPTASGGVVFGGARVITNDDLDTESEVGQVTGGGRQPRARQQRRNNSPLIRNPPLQSRAERRRAERANRGGTAVQGGGAAQGGTVVQGAPATRPPRYRPSPRSTASLSLELLPPESTTGSTPTGPTSGTYGR